MTQTTSEQPFQIVHGSISRADGAEGTAVARRLRGMPGLGAMLDRPEVQHLASALALGRLLRQTAGFITNDLRGAPGVRGYTLRQGERTILIRHGTVDVWTFNELFLLRLYEPPQPVKAIMAGVSRPVILDLGANVGMFGLDALERYPGARITAYEPDSVSAGIHRELIDRNRAKAADWTLVEACAGPMDGTVSFLPGQQTESRIVDEPTVGSVTLPMKDVLPDFARADLVKLDIEGGEWGLLADERFGAARALVLEYHPPGCPQPDTHAAAAGLLAGHGYTVVPLFEHPGGVGMVWAYRP
jgi:FkbM family methyltransferase